MQKSTARSIVFALDNDAVMHSAKPYKLTLMQRIYLSFRRLLDMLFSFILLILLLPLFLVVSLLIKRENDKSPIFRQQRVGKNGNIFSIYKFRTMKDNTPDNTATAKLYRAHKYITKIGKFLRSTSIDELPQLINVLKGEMSLIGPRPLVPSEEEIHILRLRHGVYGIRPGLTGLAQINGRDLVTPEEKIVYDQEYLKTLGLRTDLKIFFRTITAVLSRRGISEGDRAEGNKTAAQCVASIRQQPQTMQGIDEDAPVRIYERTGSS